MMESTPVPPRVVSRDEWLAARRELLAKEKEATRVRDALNAERRRLPMVRVEKDYVFEGPEGKTGLLGLFGGRRQLVVHHFMWLDDRDEGCPSCSMLADTLGNLVHLRAANTAFAFVSRAPAARLEAFRARMGWSLPFYSSAGSDFNYDFQATIDPGRGAVEYNYRDVTALGGWNGYAGDVPGQSVFLREGDEVFHTYSAYARGTEMVSNIFGILDLTPLGRQEAAGIQHWVRHHDRYEEVPRGPGSCCGAGGS